MTQEELFVRAKNAFTIRDFPLAERFARQLAQIAPTNSAVHNLLGNIYTKMRRANHAIRSYQRAIELDQQNPEAHNNIGVTYKREGNLPAAIKAFEIAHALAPDRPDVAYNLGNAHKQAGDPKRAAAFYRLAIKIDPKFTLAYNNLGSMYENLGRHADAIEIYRKGLASDSNNPTLRYNLGVALESKGDFPSAFSEYTYALRSRPGWVDGLNNLGVTLEKLDRPEQAEQVFEEILKQDPDNTKVRNNLGHALVRLGKTPEAERSFREALDRDPVYVRAALNLEQLQEETGRYEEALGSLSRVAKEEARDPEITLRRARVLTALGRLREASNALKRVLARDPKNPRTHIARGNLFLKAGRKDKALASFRNAEKLDHDNAEARLSAAALLQETGRLEEATEEVSGILKTNPHAYRPRVLLAKLYSQQNRLREAQALLRTLRSENPDDEAVLRTLVDVRRREGDREGAARAANELVGLHSHGATKDDIDRLATSLDMYEQTIGDLATENEELWERNIRTFECSRWEENGGSDESLGIEAESLLFGETPDIAGEEVPIIDIGGIEPIIAVNEAEETINLEELEEELEPPPTTIEPEKELLHEPRSVGSGDSAFSGAGAPSGGRQPFPSLPDGRPAGGGPESLRETARSAEQAGRADVSHRETDDVGASRGGAMQVLGTIRVEMVQPPSAPSTRPEDEQGRSRDDSAAAEDSPGPAGDERREEPPVPAPPAPVAMPIRMPPAADTVEESKGRRKEKPARLLSYLEELTRYLPEEQRSIYDGSDMHMRLAAIKGRLRGDPGLHRQARRLPQPADQVPVTKITPSRIRDTFSFIGNLSRYHPDRDIGLALKYKIAHILGKLRKS